MPRKDNNDLDEFQKRRITMNDFIQGEPGTELIFQKDARKFNRVISFFWILNFINTILYYIIS